MGWRAVSWNLVLDPYFLSLHLLLQPSHLLSGSSSWQFLELTPLLAPILCLSVCLPAARLLPAPGRPLPPHGQPGGHKGAIELRVPGLGCIKSLVSSRGSRGRPQAQDGRVLGAA